MNVQVTYYAMKKIPPLLFYLIDKKFPPIRLFGTARP